jgi:hypothetical protein
MGFRGGVAPPIRAARDLDRSIFHYSKSSERSEHPRERSDRGFHQASFGYQAVAFYRRRRRRRRCQVSLRSHRPSQPRTRRACKRSRLAKITVNLSAGGSQNANDPHHPSGARQQWARSRPRIRRRQKRPMASRYRGADGADAKFPFSEMGTPERRPRTVSAALSLATGAVFKLAATFPHCQADG